jgi:hypothetical protein
MQRQITMAKTSQPSKDPKQTPRRLRTLTQEDLQAVTGGNGIPGQYKTSSGGGGAA